MGQSQLANTTQSLKPGMLNQIEYYSIRNRYETVDRVVENLLLLQSGTVLVRKYRKPARNHTLPL